MFQGFGPGKPQIDECFKDVALKLVVFQEFGPGKPGIDECFKDAPLANLKLVSVARIRPGQTSNW